MSSNYTPQQIKFVEVFLEESRASDDYATARKKARTDAGYPESTTYATIFSSVLELLKENLGLELAMMAPKMLNRMEQVVDNPALPGAKNIIAAASTMLDRAGIIKKEETTVNIKTPDGVLILPAKNKEEKD